MPQDFLVDLEKDIAAFEDAMRGQEAGKGTKTGAAAAIGTAMRAGLAAVVQLDAFVTNRLRADPAELAMWERARRVEYPTRARREQPAPAPAIASVAAAGA